MPMFHITAADPADDLRVSTYFCDAQTPRIALRLFEEAPFTAGLRIEHIVHAPTTQRKNRMIPWETIKPANAATPEIRAIDDEIARLMMARSQLVRSIV